MKKLTAFILFAFLSAPTLVFANGGDQRVIDGKYLINLSRAPFTPSVGVKTSMIASFVDIQKNKLITDDVIAKVRIAKHGGGGTREFLFEKDNSIITGGVLEFEYTFPEDGLHEIFFDFAFASSPETIYAAPDFLLDIQKQKNPAPLQNLWFVGIAAGILGMLSGFLLSRLKLTK